MSLQPFTFTLPLHQFDLNLLKPEARTIGSEAFKDGVTRYFAEQYGGSGQTVLVTIDDSDITVVQLPQDADPMDFMMSMLHGGRIREALPFLEALAKASPDDPGVLYNLGIAYSELGQYDEAIIRLKRAVQLDTQHAHAWTGIGVAYQRMGKPEQALEPFRRAVEAAPEDGYSLRNLGAVLTSRGETEEAVAYLRKARSVLPHDPQTTYGLAVALETTGKAEDLAEADELYKVVITRWPGHELAERARQDRTRIAHHNMRETAGGGLRPDVVMYLAGALDTFARVGQTKAREITFEVAMKGQSGLDINDSRQQYTLKSLPGKFSGMHLVSIMYAGIKQIDPNMDAGIDLSAEYEAAKALHKPQAQ